MKIKGILLLALVCLSSMAVQAQFAMINNVRVNQKMSSFCKMAELQFAERSYGEYLTSYAGYESAFVSVQEVADWVESVDITWKYTDSNTIDRMFHEIERYLLDTYGSAKVEKNVESFGTTYSVVDTFPLTKDKVWVSLAKADDGNGGQRLYVKFKVHERYY